VRIDDRGATVSDPVVFAHDAEEWRP
jgi:hypothetical protein